MAVWNPRCGAIQTDFVRKARPLPFRLASSEQKKILGAYCTQDPFLWTAERRYSSVFFLLRALILNQIGLPMKLKWSRIWLPRKRSKEKCSFTSLSVKSTKVGGATAAWVM